MRAAANHRSWFRRTALAAGGRGFGCGWQPHWMGS
jgi:hypothetical protein